MLKNTAGQKWRVFAFSLADGTPVTGDAANITGKISIDHGTAAAITDTNPTEIEGGYYLFDLEQAETNGENLAIYPASTTEGVVVIGDPGTFSTTDPAVATIAADWTNGGRLDLILDARASQTSVDDVPTNAELATALGAADDAILTQVALVKAKTDLIPAAPAAVSDIPTAAQIVNEFESQSQSDPTGFHVNVKEINGTPVIGAGVDGNKWRA